jgi:hypothetical protein
MHKSILSEIVKEQFEEKLARSGKSPRKEQNDGIVCSKDRNESEFIETITKMIEQGYALSHFEVHLAAHTGESADFIESRYIADPAIQSFEHVCYQMHESSAKIYEVVVQWITFGYQPNFLACSQGIWFCTAARNLSYEPPKKNMPPHYVIVKLPVQGSVEKEISKYCSNMNVLRYFGFGGDNEWLFLFEKCSFPINWKWESFKDSNVVKIVNHFQKQGVNFLNPIKVGDHYFSFSWTKK